MLRQVLPLRVVNATFITPRLARAASTAPRTLKILIVDGYAQRSRDEFEANGMPLASSLYEQMIRWNAPAGVDLQFDRVLPCSSDYEAPTDDELRGYDGCCFTGSSYSANDDVEDVHRQVELMGRTFACGVSSFGSCWGLQIAAQALGGAGAVGLSPKGREVGVGRKIALTPEGRAHPMFWNKPTVFEAFESHSDEVVVVPAGGVVLASNDHCRVQAMAVVHNNVESWFVQYHPEYNLSYYSQLIGIRVKRMCDMGFFQKPEDVAAYVQELQALHADPTRKDLLWKYGIGSDMMDQDSRQTEVRNWIKFVLLR